MRSGFHLPSITDMLTPFAPFISVSFSLTLLHLFLWEAPFGTDIYTKPRNSISRALSPITDTHTVSHSFCLWTPSLLEAESRLKKLFNYKNGLFLVEKEG